MKIGKNRNQVQTTKGAEIAEEELENEKVEENKTEEFTVELIKVERPEEFLM